MRKPQRTRQSTEGEQDSLETDVLSLKEKMKILSLMQRTIGDDNDPQLKQ
jgi:hypothetical protein